MSDSISDSFKTGLTIRIFFETGRQWLEMALVYFLEASCPSVHISGLENPQVFDLWLWVTWWKPTWIQVWHFEIEIPVGYGSGSPVSALMLCINLEGWVTCHAKQWPTPTSFIWHGWDVQTDNFWTIGIQGIYLECNKILLGMFDICELMVSEPGVYRLYAQSAITFYLACLTCANRWFLNHWYIGYIKYHFIWHGWDVWTNNFWTIGIQGICSECNNILFGLFDMCKLAISEPLVYRLYVWSAISFYLACLTCANPLFLNHLYIGYMFRVQ